MAATPQNGLTQVRLQRWLRRCRLGHDRRAQRFETLAARAQAPW